MTHRGSSRWLSPLPSQFLALFPFDSSHRDLFPPRPNSPRRTAGASKNTAPSPEVIQRQIGVKDGWQPPRTAWGHPNLTGAWTSDSVHGIPRERPVAQGNRVFVTEDEYTERVAREEKTRQSAYNASGAGTGGRDRALRGDTTFRLTSLIVSPANGRMPAITPFGESRRAPRDRGSFGEGPFNTFEDFTLYDRCITRGIVGSVMPVPYGNGNVILQTPDQFVISYEMIHDTRAVPLDGRPHIAASLRQYLGDSRGSWQGDTLVVETTNFTDRTGVQGGTATDFGTVRPCVSLSTSPASPRTSCSTT